MNGEKDKIEKENKKEYEAPEIEVNKLNNSGDPVEMLAEDVVNGKVEDSTKEFDKVTESAVDDNQNAEQSENSNGNSKKTKKSHKRLSKKQKVFVICVTAFIILAIFCILGYIYSNINNATEAVAEEVQSTLEADINIEYNKNENDETITVVINSDTEIAKIEQQIENDSEIENEFSYEEDDSWETSEDNLNISKTYTTNTYETFKLTFKDVNYNSETVIVEITQYQEITLYVDTNGLNVGTEVSILINKDETVIAICETDDEYTTYSEKAVILLSGTIVEDGINIVTLNETLINLSELSEEEQANVVTVINNVSETTDEDSEECNSTQNTSSTSSKSSGSSSSGSSSSGSSNSDGTINHVCTSAFESYNNLWFSTSTELRNYFYTYLSTSYTGFDYGDCPHGYWYILPY